MPLPSTVKFRTAIAVAAATGLSACATLPTNGPTGRAILHQSQEAGGYPFQIVDIDAQTMGTLSAAADTGALAGLARDGRTDTLGPGDVLSIQIFEVGVTLFGGHASLGGAADDEDAAVPTANTQQVGNGIGVDARGDITVPYVGTIHVAGMTPVQVGQRIVAGLRGLSQSPQAVVSLVRNLSNSVIVMGAATNPGRLPLSVAGERLLDVIAESGGIARSVQSGTSTATGTGNQDIVVRVTRSGFYAEQRLDTIIPGAPDDLQLLGGDRVELVREPRTFTVFGAIDRISQLPFESSTLTLAEALARAGGPSDARADPRSIFVFRLVTDPDHAPPRALAYRLNMMQAQGFFAAQRFTMHDRDIIYIANASANQPIKFAQILGQLFAPVAAVRTVTQ